MPKVNKCLNCNTEIHRTSLRCSSCAQKLIYSSEEKKKWVSSIHKGKKLSDETKRKISEIQKGRKQKPETIEKRRLKQIGRKHTEETRRKMSETAKKNRNLWRGGTADEIDILRHSLEYKLWREAVFKRDDWTCVWCGLKSGNGKAVYLEADHIKPFSLFPELRFAIDNGRTLCWECHSKTDTYGWKNYNKIRIAKLQSKLAQAELYSQQ